MHPYKCLTATKAKSCHPNPSSPSGTPHTTTSANVTSLLPKSNNPLPLAQTLQQQFDDINRLMDHMNQQLNESLSTSSPTATRIKIPSEYNLQKH